MIVYLVLCSLALFACFILYKYRKYKQLVKLVDLPGPPPIPFIGNVPEIAATPCSLFGATLRWLHKYEGNMVQYFILHQRIIFFGAIDEAILKDLYASKCYIKGVTLSDFSDMASNGLFQADGEVWARGRKICAGAFHISRLQLFVDPMRYCTEVLLQRLSEKASTPNKMQGLDIDEIFMHTTLDVIGRTMFSIDLPSLEQLSEAIQEYLRISFAQINPINQYNPLHIWRKKKAIKFTLGYVGNLLQRRIQERSTRTPGSAAMDLLDLLLDAQDPDTGARLTNEEIVDQVITFIIAGHETTAHTLSFAVACIAQHPHVAKLLEEELDKVVGPSPSGILFYEDLPKLQYLTAFIKEVMRMYPVGPGILRELAEDHKLGKHNIPKGTIVGLNVIALHYDPKLWKDSETFDPSRFLKNESDDDAKSNISFLSYAPFGHGPRGCIGQHFAMLEMKLVLSAVLHKFNFRMFPMSYINPVPQLTIRPKNLHMIVYKK